MNPLIRNPGKIEECSHNNAATYKGVAAKTCFFMAWAIIGVIAFFAFRPMLEIDESMHMNSECVSHRMRGDYNAVTNIVEGVIYILSPVSSCWWILTSYKSCCAPTPKKI